jgi:hypothetical protein
MANGNKIKTAVTEDSDKKGFTVKFNHETLVPTGTKPSAGDPSTPLSDGTDFTVIDNITTDGYGHVSAITFKKYEARDTKFYLGNTSVSDPLGNRITICEKLYDDTNTLTNNTSSFSIGSTSTTSNLVFSKTANSTAVNIDLVWGTF